MVSLSMGLGVVPFNVSILGGLSLHLNHLIGSCMASYNWPFGTLPFGFFLVKFGHKGHILGPILVILEICHFLVIPGLFEYF